MREIVDVGRNSTWSILSRGHVVARTRLRHIELLFVGRDEIDHVTAVWCSEQRAGCIDETNAIELSQQIVKRRQKWFEPNAVMHDTSFFNAAPASADRHAECGRKRPYTLSTTVRDCRQYIKVDQVFGTSAWPRFLDFTSATRDPVSRDSIARAQIRLTVATETSKTRAASLMRPCSSRHPPSQCCKRYSYISCLW